ncbi:hypothetical protein RhiirA5_446548, partial [Rhizophagus irregularis]
MHDQEKTNKRTLQNPNHNNHFSNFQRRPQATPQTNLYNWDVQPTAHINRPSPIPKGKQPEYSKASNDELIKKITHLETIIKDLSSEVGALNIKQKEHTKNITLLQEQE